MSDLLGQPGYFLCPTYHCKMRWEACAKRYYNAHHYGPMATSFPGAGDWLCRQCKIGAEHYRKRFKKRPPRVRKMTMLCRTNGCVNMVRSGVYCDSCRERMRKNERNLKAGKPAVKRRAA